MNSATVRHDYVTWRSLAAVLTTLVCALVSAGAWCIQNHAEKPHAGAVSENELQLVLSHIETIQSDLHELRQDVKELMKK